MPGYAKALILAGGKGTRLRRLGQVLPKCMVPVYDQPLILHQIAQCVHANIFDITISVAREYMPLIEAMFARYKPSDGVRIRTVAEETPLGPIDGLVSLIPLFKDEATILILGDEYYESHLPFDQLKKRLLDEEMVLGVVQTDNPDRIDCNVTLDSSGRVNGIKDKPSKEQIQGNLKWCGFVAFHPGVLDRAEQAVRKKMVPGKYIGDLFEGMRQMGTSVGILKFPHVHLNLNTVDDLLLATLLETRRNWLREQPERIQDLNQAIELLFRSLKIRG